MNKCICGAYYSYFMYKKDNLERINFFSDKISDEDCVNCSNLSTYGKVDPSIEEVSSRVKKRYNVDCKCGHYVPYSDAKKAISGKNNKTSKFFSSIIKNEECYNCFLMKKRV